jgi:hypothetical protein
MLDRPYQAIKKTVAIRDKVVIKEKKLCLT